MALERLFRRNRPTRKEDDNSPAGLWLKCDSCNAQIYRKDLIANLYVCPECSYHYSMPVDARLEMLADDGTFERWSGHIRSEDPLEFHDTQPYTERLQKAEQRQGRPDAIVTGACELAGRPVCLVVMDFFFLGGSMGSVVGEEIATAAERAADGGRPLVAVTASGGARMQEGALSLMQMAKTTVALQRLARARLPYVTVLSHPTTGGVTASFATLGDVIFAEPGALISFAGPRVIQQTIKQDLPEGFQRAEFLLQKGMVDDVVPRADLKQRLALVLRALGGVADRVRTESLGAAAFERPIEELAAKVQDMRAYAADQEVDLSDEIELLQARLDRLKRDTFESLTRWQRVQVARAPGRPTALDYLGAAFTGFIELHGDRTLGDDPAMVAGLAELGGRQVVAIGQQKGRDTKENISRNFGMSHPSGYRKAMRMFDLADRFGLPVVCLVDTPGAYPGLAAEEQGQAWVIAACIQRMSRLQVPAVSLVIGEGGSGGALAIGVANRVLILENAIYSVISPESCAAILWRDAGEAEQAAEALRLTATDLLEQGVVDRVVPEPLGGAHSAREEAIATVRDVLVEELGRLEGMSAEALLEQRYQRFRSLGRFAAAA